jgi:hypothetical protein
MQNDAAQPADTTGNAAHPGANSAHGARAPTRNAKWGQEYSKRAGITGNGRRILYRIDTQHLTAHLTEDIHVDGGPRVPGLCSRAGRSLFKVGSACIT